MTVQETLAKIRGAHSFDDNGRVTDLGRFQYEHISTLYFFDALMDGDQGEAIGDSNIYELCDDERTAFNFAAEYTHFSLFIREDGFVFGDAITTEELEKTLAYYAALAEKEQNDDPGDGSTWP